MSNITKKQETALVVAGAEASEWGTNELSTQDIVIPKILLMQGLSELVSSGKAKLGDYMDSVEESKLGGVDNPIEIIPFQMEKFWIHQKFNGKRFEYARTEKMTPENQSLPWDYVENGNKMRRLYTFNFYVIIPGKTLPYLISFSSTSAKAGKELATQMYTTNAINKLPPPAVVMELGCKIDKNDDGTFAVKTIKMKRKATFDEIASAFEWFKTFKASSVKVDDKGDYV